MIKRILFYFLFCIIVPSVSHSQNVIMVPPNVNYNDTSVATFANLIFDSIGGGIMKHNILFPNNKYYNMPIFTPSQSYSPKIKLFYNIAGTSGQLLERLNKYSSNTFIWINFDEQRILNCKDEQCEVPVTLNSFRSNGTRSEDKLEIIYTSKTFILKEASKRGIGFKVQEILNNHSHKDL